MIALESPTFAHQIFFPRIKTITVVEPENVQSIVDYNNPLEVWRNAKFKQF